MKEKLRGQSRLVATTFRLGGEQRDVRAEVDPGEQADDEGERAVEVAGVLHHVADVVAAERLQKLVEDARADRAAAKLPPAHLACGQHAKCRPRRGRC